MGSRLTLTFCSWASFNLACRFLISSSFWLSFNSRSAAAAAAFSFPDDDRLTAVVCLVLGVCWTEDSCLRLLPAGVQGGNGGLAFVASSWNCRVAATWSLVKRSCWSLVLAFSSSWHLQFIYWEFDICYVLAALNSVFMHELKTASMQIVAWIQYWYLRHQVAAKLKTVPDYFRKICSCKKNTHNLCSTTLINIFFMRLKECMRVKQNRGNF